MNDFNDNYSGPERRSAKRKQAVFTMNYKVKGAKEEISGSTTTSDISPAGISFIINQVLKIGSKISIELKIPSLSSPIPLNARIIRIDEQPNHQEYFYAAEFEDIKNEHKLVIEHFVHLIDIEGLQKKAIKNGASDIHLVAHQPPYFRINGKLIPIDTAPIDPKDLTNMILSMLTDQQKETLLKKRELDFSHSMPGGVRFRINVHFEKGHMEAAFRVIPSEVKTISQLGLPTSIEALAKKPKGLIIVTGPTGSGKSTTLASMINLINKERRCMIISIEDPIEYVHTTNKSIIKQREIGSDSLSFAEALKHVLRQDPDVILVGEMRDLESISMAITAAETGHLVLTTLHTTDTTECINRIVDAYPAAQQNQVRAQLASCLQGIIAQNLLPRSDGKGRVAAVEVMVATPAIRNLIRELQPGQIESYLKTGAKYGMQTMDDALYKLAINHIIDPQIALSFAKDPLRFQGIGR